MKIIVFGGAGFLGSHVADELSRRGHDVIIYDIVPSPYLSEKQTMIVGDILDERLVRDTVKNCDVIYHFAGIADLDEAKSDPVNTVRINVLGTAIVIESARQAGVKRFVLASSIYVYSDAGSFYRSSKQASELLLENYHRVYGMNFNVLRYGSLYGPRSDETNWMHRALKQALTEYKIVREGDGEELREYIHISDAARLSVDILADRYCNQHLILTGNQQIKVHDLLLMVREILSGSVHIEYKPTASKEHYEVTPFVFRPQIARRVMAREYVDLGQGILELLGHIHREVGLKCTTVEA